MESEPAPFLRVTGLVKSFGGVQALKGVGLEIARGEVHGLVGANGAGKSTLVRHLAGVYQPEAGTIEIDGVPTVIRDPRRSSALGLTFIHQELSLVPEFSVLQNLVLGLNKPSTAGIVRWKAIRQRAEGVARRLRFDHPLSTKVNTLTVAQQWMVSIGRALMQDARLIAMDEPTASLSAAEAERLFTVIGELSSAGVAIVYVSHRLDEVLRLCRRVTVFRDGASVATLVGAEVTKAALVNGIVGREVGAIFPAPSRAAEGRVVLEARHLRRLPAVKDVSFTAHVGEVLGLAGLVGAGRTETVRLIFGADRLDSGEILVDGRPLGRPTPVRAMRAGIALVPEERRAQGLVLKESVDFNVNLASWAATRPVARLPLISRRRSRARARRAVDTLGIKTRSVRTAAGQLSGGNQQKVVIGKWTARGARVVIFDEPSRGVDVGARQELYDVIRKMAEEGVAVIMISSEFEELTLCDRVLVLVEGRVAGSLQGREISEPAILQLCYADSGNRRAS